MRPHPTLSVLALAGLVATPLIAAPRAADQATHVQHRGAAVMGFDQDKTVHRFLLYEDGGAIEVSVKVANDAANRDAIRAHLPHIAHLFGQGDFAAPMLVHDRKDVPGTAVMAERKATIAYTYHETPMGGRVDITTTDKAAIASVHDFLKFQISDHKTGDPLTVRKR